MSATQIKFDIHRKAYQVLNVVNPDCHLRSEGASKVLYCKRKNITISQVQHYNDYKYLGIG